MVPGEEKVRAQRMAADHSQPSHSPDPPRTAGGHPALPLPDFLLHPATEPGQES